MRIQEMRCTLPVILLASLIFPGALAAARPQSDEAKAAPSNQYVPPGPRRSVEIGDFYFKRKKYAGALSRYKEALQADPHFAPAYLGMGKVYEKLGLKQKALEAYQTYLDELPSKKEADEAKEVHRAIERLEKKLGKTSAPRSGRR